MKMRDRLLIGTSKMPIAAIALMMVPSLGAAQSACGETTIVAAGETLADVAARCEVTPEALREANPALTSDQVAAGSELAVPNGAEAAEDAEAVDGEEGDLLDRARDLLQDAGRELEEAARQAGQSVSDYLSSDPDIGQDLRDFAERYLPDFSVSTDEGTGGPSGSEPGVTVTPAAPKGGEEITLVATGLRSGAAAQIGIGPSRTEYDVVAQATADAHGRIETTLTMPDWASAADRIVIVVETENVQLRSDPIEVAAE
jgi:hypothetical protein